MFKECGVSNRQEAIEDCKWALKLGEVALREHFMQWCGVQCVNGWTEEDIEYANAMNEIREKYRTGECLIEEKMK